MPNLIGTQRDALVVLQAADVPLSESQVSRWWSTLGPLPSAKPTEIVEHGRALAAVLHRGAPRKAPGGPYLPDVRNAIELAKLGQPCPVLPAVVYQVGRWAKWEQTGRLRNDAATAWDERLSATEANREAVVAQLVASPVIGAERLAGAMTYGADSNRPVLPDNAYLSGAEYTLGLLMGADLPRGEEAGARADLGTLAGLFVPGDNLEAAQLYEDIMRALGNGGRSPLAGMAQLVREAGPMELARVVRAAAALVSNPNALRSICHAAGHLLAFARVLPTLDEAPDLETTLGLLTTRIGAGPAAKVPAVEHSGRVTKALGR